MRQTEDLRQWLNMLRVEWFRMMRPLGAYVPWELQDRLQLEEQADEGSLWNRGLMHEPPALRDEHLRNCTVVSNRTELLRRLPKGGTVAEVGTLQGAFARAILEIVEPDELHVIDHCLQQHVRRMAEDPTIKDRFHLHEGDSATVLSSFPDRMFDWIYIDAQHTYEGVKRDIAAARSKVTPDGLLVFNDYTVWSYVEMEPYGVVAAVNELCLEGWQVVYLALPNHMYCDVAIRRMRN